jgi:hypothetical protein
MSITIIENDKPELNVGSAVCDGGLHAKLNSYELTSFLNGHTLNMFVGRPKSGKSSLMQGLFRSSKCLKKVYHDIYLFQPIISRGSMKDDIFNGIPENQKYNELSLENLTKVKNEIESSDPKFNKVIILDDMAAYLKNNSTLKLLKEIIYNRRHLRVSIYILSQTYFSMPKDLRKLVSNFVIFKVSKNEMHEIFDENIENLEKMADKISKVVYDQPFNFLFVNVDTQSLYKNWDRLEIKEPNNLF